MQCRLFFAVLALLFLLLVGFLEPVSAKGLEAIPPLSIGISKNYTSLGRNLPTISSDEVNSIASTIENIGALYNSTWRPVIHSLLANNSSSLFTTWVSGIGVSLYPSVMGIKIPTQYTYAVYVFVTNGNQSFFTHKLPMDDPIIQKLIRLNMSLYLSFGLSGTYAGLLDRTMNATDGYMNRFSQLTPQLVQDASAQLPGRFFGSLTFSLLDEKIGKLTIAREYGQQPYVQYYGPATTTMPPVTTTVSSTLTATITTTTLSESTLIQTLTTNSNRQIALPPSPIFEASTVILGALLAVVIILALRRR